MSVSFAQPTPLTCARCGATFSAEVFLIVHGPERPDLLARARSGELHRFACPSCAHVADIDAPLVICRPDQSPPVLFSPAAQTSEEQDGQMAGALLGQLRFLLGQDWQEARVEQIGVVPRGALPARLAGSVSSGGPPASPPGAPGLLEAVQSFVMAGTWPESQAAVNAHPQLVSREGVALLAMLRDHARSDNQEGPAAGFEEHRALLARCLEIGVSAAFAEKTGGLPPEVMAEIGRANASEARFRARGDRQALDDAAASWERILSSPALAAAPARARLRVLNGAGGAFLRRSWARGSAHDLQRAIDLWQEAVKLTPADSPDLPSILNNLGTGLSTRYARTGRVGDLDGSVEVYERAVQLTPADSPDLPSRLNNLGTGLSTRYARTGRVGDLDGAVEVYERACRGGQEHDPNATITASRSWSAWAAGRGAWAEVLRATGYGLRAAEQIHRAQALRADQESWRAESHRLPALRGFAAAHLGDLREAALALELGRARFLAEVLDRDRADLDALRAQWPAPVAAYQEAAERLRLLERRQPGDDGDEATARRERRGAISAARTALDSAIGAIRQLPGQGGFLAPPRWEDMQLDLEEGVPVIYFAVTEVGGLALILLRRGADVHAEGVWLEGLTESALRALLFGPAEDPALGGWLGAMVGYKTTRTDASRQRWHDNISTTTRALWALAMGAVVERLDQLGVEEAVLIPGGLLGLLPLHAAEPDAPGPRTALDTIAWRTAPSLRALGHARRMAEAPAATPRELFALCEPRPVRASALPFTPLEVQAVTAFFARPEQLAHEQATRAAALAALPGARIAHFSCHGVMDWAQPLKSGLVMAHDELLTVQDLLNQRVAGARLAVLSACETGVPGTKLPDEVVALPAAFLQAGFAGVLASLWSVYDLSTALLMVRFYELWRQEGLRPAVALQRAQRWMRDTTNAEKVAHFDRQIPQLNAAQLPTTAAEVLLPAVEVTLGTRDPEARDFAHPVWWAAFTLTGG